MSHYYSSLAALLDNLSDQVTDSNFTQGASHSHHSLEHILGVIALLNRLAMNDGQGDYSVTPLELADANITLVECAHALTQMNNRYDALEALAATPQEL